MKQKQMNKVRHLCLYCRGSDENDLAKKNPEIVLQWNINVRQDNDDDSEVTQYAQ
jgi:hypothetical protein